MRFFLRFKKCFYGLLIKGVENVILMNMEQYEFWTCTASTGDVEFCLVFFCPFHEIIVYQNYVNSKAQR